MEKRTLHVFPVHASFSFIRKNIGPWCKGTNFLFCQFLLSTYYIPCTGWGPGRYRDAQGMACQEQSQGPQEQSQGLGRLPSGQPDLSNSLLGPTWLFLLSSLVRGESASCSRRSAQGSLSFSPHPHPHFSPSTPTPIPGWLKRCKRESERFCAVCFGFNEISFTRVNCN